MNIQDKEILKKIIEECNSNNKAYMKIDSIMAHASQIKEDKARSNILQITGLNPNVFSDNDIIEMVKDLAEMILLHRSRPKTYTVNFKFILFKKPFRIRF